MTKKPRDQGLDDNFTLIGFLLGLLVGGAATLLGVRRNDKETHKRVIKTDQPSREKLKNSAPLDPAADSIAAGKAAARRRLEELGMNK